MTGACAEGGGGLVQGYALNKYFHFHANILSDKMPPCQSI